MVFIKAKKGKVKTWYEYAAIIMEELQFMKNQWPQKYQPGELAITINMLLN